MKIYNIVKLSYVAFVACSLPATVKWKVHRPVGNLHLLLDGSKGLAQPSVHFTVACRLAPSVTAKSCWMSIITTESYFRPRVAHGEEIIATRAACAHPLTLIQRNQMSKRRTKILALLISATCHRSKRFSSKRNGRENQLKIISSRQRIFLAICMNTRQIFEWSTSADLELPARIDLVN